MARRSSRSTTDTSTHRPKAYAGIAIGLVLSISGAVMAVLGREPINEIKWSWIVVAGLPLIAWGCSHLARQRGYPSGAAYGLFGFALMVAYFVSSNRTQQIVCIGFLFVAILPITVLLLLPKRTKYLRRW